MQNTFADLLQVVHDYMSDPETVWPICRDGEFRHGDSQAEMKLDHMGGSILSTRSAFRIILTPATRLIPCESVSQADGLWNQAALFCLPQGQSEMARRTSIAELGNDLMAIRPEDRLGILFDLGTGSAEFDFCVRSPNQDLCDFLRCRAGTQADGTLLRALREQNAHYVIQSRLGRVEWFSGKPDTAILFDQFLLPDGLKPCLAFVPPQRTDSGAVDQATFDTFRILYQSFADPGLVSLKEEVAKAVRHGAAPATIVPAGDVERETVRVALRQLEYLEEAAGNLPAWRTAFG